MEKKIFVSELLKHKQFSQNAVNNSLQITIHQGDKIKKSDFIQIDEKSRMIFLNYLFAGKTINQVAKAMKTASMKSWKIQTI